MKLNFKPTYLLLYVLFISLSALAQSSPSTRTISQSVEAFRGRKMPMYLSLSLAKF